MRTRRTLLHALAVGGLGAMTSTARTEVESGPSGAKVVRLSRGSFPGSAYERVRARLGMAQETLIPAIRALPGCLHYWAGIDPVSNTMVNVSVWSSGDAARQMETLAAMRALASEFTSMGVAFERPIVNYESLWEL